MWYLLAMVAVPVLRDNRAMRKRSASDRSQGFSLRGTFVLGLLVVPLTCALTFFGLTVSTQAMFGAQQAGFSEAFGALLYQQGWLPTPAPSPTEAALSPTASNTAAAPAAVDAGIQPATLTPSATARLTATASHSPTATATLTSTSTPTASHTSTETATATPTPSATSTLTLTASRTPSPSPFPTNTPQPSLTPTPAPATDTPQPSNTPGASATPVSSTCDATINTAFEGEVVSLVNQERQSRGLAAYTVDSRLRGAARAHATDMACNHFTGHTGSDGSSVGERATAHGYSWSWIGENYYVTGNTSDGPQIAFDWWMNSTPHRDNLLSPNYTDFGVGYIYSADSDYGGYFVIVFGRPQ